MKKSITMRPDSRPVARILSRAGMLLFCVALAAAVCFECLRQYLHARFAYGSLAAAPARPGKVQREGVGMALTAGQRIA